MKKMWSDKKLAILVRGGNRESYRFFSEFKQQFPNVFTLSWAGDLGADYSMIKNPPPLEGIFLLYELVRNRGFEYYMICDDDHQFSMDDYSLILKCLYEYNPLFVRFWIKRLQPNVRLEAQLRKVVKRKGSGVVCAACGDFPWIIHKRLLEILYPFPSFNSIIIHYFFSHLVFLAAAEKCIRINDIEVVDRRHRKNRKMHDAGFDRELRKWNELLSFMWSRLPDKKGDISRSFMERNRYAELLAVDKDPVNFPSWRILQFINVENPWWKQRKLLFTKYKDFIKKA